VALVLSQAWAARSRVAMAAPGRMRPLCPARTSTRSATSAPRLVWSCFGRPLSSSPWV